MSATIASRTPEGIPNRCPICGGMAWMEPSSAGDAPCPRCGALLWFEKIRPVSRSRPYTIAQRTRKHTAIQTMSRLWDRAKSRLRRKPKAIPPVETPVFAGDLYDPWLDG